VSGEAMTGREDPPPEVVEAWVRRWAGTGTDARGEALLDGATRALEAALARPGRNREGAEALLAADALLTWAVEDAAATDDVDGELEGILRRVIEVRGGV
jgi:hypothetical protein